MLQSVDIQEAVLQLWNSSVDVTTGLTVVVPGGLHFGRVAEKDDTGSIVASPYASYTIKEQAPQRTGLPGYLQVFYVNINIYANQPGEATGEISRTLDSLFDFMTVEFSLNNRQNIRVLHSNRKEAELKEDNARLQSTDVLLTSARYEWLCEGVAPT